LGAVFFAFAAFGLDATFGFAFAVAFAGFAFGAGLAAGFAAALTTGFTIGAAATFTAGAFTIALGIGRAFAWGEMGSRLRWTSVNRGSSPTT
jgi:hypothetical protein